MPGNWFRVQKFFLNPRSESNEDEIRSRDALLSFQEAPRFGCQRDITLSLLRLAPVDIDVRCCVVDENTIPSERAALTDSQSSVHQEGCDRLAGFSHSINELVAKRTRQDELAIMLAFQLLKLRNSIYQFPIIGDVKSPTDSRE
jgi:hypothetical protein